MKQLKRRLDRVARHQQAAVADDTGLRRRMLGRRIMADPEALEGTLELFRWINAHTTDYSAPWQETARRAFALPEAKPMLERMLPVFERIGT